MLRGTALTVSATWNMATDDLSPRRNRDRQTAETGNWTHGHLVLARAPHRDDQTVEAWL